jgi:predicted CXXCH cytochrome family protein
VGTDTLIRFPGVGRDTMCPQCHAPTSAYTEFLDPLLKSKHAEGASQTVNEPFTCVTCHVPLFPAGQHPNNLMKVNGASPCVVVTDTPAGNGFCYKCHGVGSTLPYGDMTGFEFTGHATIPAPLTGANITCDTCHESHASRNSALLRFEGFEVCLQCHTSASSNPDEPDIYNRLTLYDASNQKHAILPQDQLTGARMTCQNCHNTHSTTKALPLVDPHNPGPTGTWLQPRTDEKAFCFTCHDGQTLPSASIDTSPWAPTVLARNGVNYTTDIKTAYQTSIHGFASSADPAVATSHLRADMGYKYGDILECRACHDPHGTPNRTAINSRVPSADGSKIVGGLLVASATGIRDYRFFCTACHTWDSADHDPRATLAAGVPVDTTVFPVNCAACHKFGSLIGGL